MVDKCLCSSRELDQHMTKNERLLNSIFGTSSSARMIQSSEASNQDVYNFIPFVAEKLVCKQDDVRIVEYYTMFKDTEIDMLRPRKSYGLNMVENQHHQFSCDNACLKIGILEYHLDGTKFFIVHYHSYRYILYKNGNLLPIARLAKSCGHTTVSSPPILEDGMIEAVLKDTIGFYTRRKRLVKLGARPTRGVILRGEAGNGKTMLCRYIDDLASNKSINVTNVTSSQLQNAVANDKLSNLMNVDGIIFFDDIDISYLSRKQGGNASMACSILAAMDGIQSIKDGCSIRIFTTNESTSDFDSAFMRKGRVDVVYTIKPPSQLMRLKFIESWSKELLDGVNAIELSNKTNGYSFAELQDIRTELAYHSIDNTKVSMEHLLNLKEYNLIEKKTLGF